MTSSRGTLQFSRCQMQIAKTSLYHLHIILSVVSEQGCSSGTDSSWTSHATPCNLRTFLLTTALSLGPRASPTSTRTGQALPVLFLLPAACHPTLTMVGSWLQFWVTSILLWSATHPTPTGMHQPLLPYMLPALIPSAPPLHSPLITCCLMSRCCCDHLQQPASKGLLSRTRGGT